MFQNLLYFMYILKTTYQHRQGILKREKVKLLEMKKTTKNYAWFLIHKI